MILAASVAVNAGVFTLAFRIGTTRGLRIRQVAPGAVIAAVFWQLLQSFGAVYVEQVVTHSSATNSVFALVLGLLGFLIHRNELDRSLHGNQRRPGRPIAPAGFAHTVHR